MLITQYFETLKEMGGNMGIMVAFEGLPGCGKTTAVALVTKELVAQGIRAYAVDIDTAASTPELRVFADAYSLADPRHIMALWLLRIQQHEAIQAIRADMDVIVSDRSWWSTLAIDGYGNGVARSFLRMIGQQIVLPDVVFLLHAPLSVLLQRKGMSRTLQDLAFARRVARGYRALARAYGWILVDAARTPEEVVQDCLAAIRVALIEKARAP